MPCPPKEQKKLDDLLMSAAQKNDAASVAELLKKGANPDATHPTILSPFMMACLWDAADAVRLMLDAGANPNQRDARYKSPALFMSGKPAIIRLLLDAGADVNAREGEYNANILFKIDVSKNIESAKMLIDAGADIHARDDFGRTPLISTVSRIDSHDTLPFIQLLLAHGADPFAKDDMGRTAFQRAQDMRYPQHAECLAKAMQAAENNARHEKDVAHHMQALGGYRRPGRPSMPGGR